MATRAESSRTTTPTATTAPTTGASTQPVTQPIVQPVAPPVVSPITETPAPQVPVAPTQPVTAPITTPTTPVLDRMPDLSTWSNTISPSPTSPLESMQPIVSPAAPLETITAPLPTEAITTPTLPTAETILAQATPTAPTAPAHATSTRTPEMTTQTAPNNAFSVEPKTNLDVTAPAGSPVSELGAQTPTAGGTSWTPIINAAEGAGLGDIRPITEKAAPSIVVPGTEPFPTPIPKPIPDYQPVPGTPEPGADPRGIYRPTPTVTPHTMLPGAFKSNLRPTRQAAPNNWQATLPNWQGYSGATQAAQSTPRAYGNATSVNPFTNGAANPFDRYRNRFQGFAQGGIIGGTPMQGWAPQMQPGAQQGIGLQDILMILRNIPADFGQSQQQPLRNYAEGGVIPKPMALVDPQTGQAEGMMGEAGPEAIVPLSDQSGQGFGSKWSDQGVDLPTLLQAIVQAAGGMTPELMQVIVQLLQILNPSPKGGDGMPPQGMPPQGGPPQGMPPMPPQGGPPQQFAQGGVVGDYDPYASFAGTQELGYTPTTQDQYLLDSIASIFKNATPYGLVEKLATGRDVNPLEEAGAGLFGGVGKAGKEAEKIDSLFNVMKKYEKPLEKPTTGLSKAMKTPTLEETFKVGGPMSTGQEAKAIENAGNETISSMPKGGIAGLDKYLQETDPEYYNWWMQVATEPSYMEKLISFSKQELDDLIKAISKNPKLGPPRK